MRYFFMFLISFLYACGPIAEDGSDGKDGKNGAGLTMTDRVSCDVVWKVNQTSYFKLKYRVVKYASLDVFVSSVSEYYKSNQFSTARNASMIYAPGESSDGYPIHDGIFLFKLVENDSKLSVKRATADEERKFTCNVMAVVGVDDEDK